MADVGFPNLPASNGPSFTASVSGLIQSLGSAYLADRQAKRETKLATTLAEREIAIAQWGARNITTGVPASSWNPFGESVPADLQPGAPVPFWNLGRVLMVAGLALAGIIVAREVL